MPFELTRTYIEELRTAIKESDEDWLIREAGELHSADIAEIFDELNLTEAQFVFRLLEKEKASDVIVALEEDVRDKFLDSLSSQEIAENVIESLESDDAADMIGELPDEKQDEVISMLEDLEQASDIVDLLNYEEGTAGALMA
ncbi:MAG: magnesium transporter MgtE N-terminal domain-containing protein, partial [Salibacteraceae bacterium]